MLKTEDDFYMQRCLNLAKLGFGKVAPNPMVGSVIVYNNRIIGEGYHYQYGKAHAEVNAINSILDCTLLKKSTLYVNLEPCSHFGKTPPCADLIIEHKIPRVVIGTIDSFSKVKGKGVEKLLKAEIDVKVGVLEDKCYALNKRFFTFYNKKRPYIILKWAQSKDGFIGKENIPNFPVSNSESKTLNQLWRTKEAAVLVGTKTALLDKPNLTVREFTANSPIRLIIDKQLTTNQSYSNNNKTIIFNSIKNQINETVELVKVEDDSTPTSFINEMLNHLYKKNIQSIIVEGGAITLKNFLQAGVWDELRVFKSNENLYQGVKAPFFNLATFEQIKISNNTLYFVKNE